MKRFREEKLVCRSLFAFAADIRSLMLAHCTGSVRLVLWVIEQSETGLTHYLRPPRVHVGYLIEVLPHLSIVRLRGPFNFRSSSAIQLSSVLCSKPPGGEILFLGCAVEDPVLSAIRTDASQGCGRAL